MPQIVRIDDLVDVTQATAQQYGFIGAGLATSATLAQTGRRRTHGEIATATEPTRQYVRGTGGSGGVPTQAAPPA